MQARNRPLDNQDRAIMRALQKNARLSNAELAEIVGMSTTACWNRTRQLETDGYIRGYVALLDQQKLGFADVVLITKKLTLVRRHIFWVPKDEYEKHYCQGHSTESGWAI